MPEDDQLGANLTCFIVSPIGDRLEPVGQPGRARYEQSIVMWEEVFEPACAHFGMSPVRADRIAEAGEIPDQIFTYLRDADVVIADLSDANPNVMYELGLRHSQQGKMTLQIGEYGRLPFDVTTIRTIQFNRTTAGLIGARNELIDSLRASLNGSGGALRATSIFSAAASAPVDVVSDVARSVAPNQDDSPAVEPGIIDILAEGEGALSHVIEVMSEFSAGMSAVGERSTQFAADAAESDAQGRGFAGKLLLTRALATELQPTADGMEELANAFYDDISRLGAMVQYVVTRYESGAEEVADDGVLFLNSMLSLVNSAEEGAVGLTVFRDGTRVLSQSARDLDPVAKALKRASNRIIEGIAVISGWRESISALIPSAADASAP